MRRHLLAASIALTAPLVTAFSGAATATPAFFTGTTTQLTTNPLTQLDPAISGDNVVLTDLRNGNEDVYLVRIGGGETQVTSATNTQRLQDVSGDTVVYTDSGGGTGIYRYDIATGTNTQLTSGPADTDARIDGTTVVFERGTSNTDVVMTDLVTGVETALAATSALEMNPVVGGARVVFERRTGVGAPGEIVVLDLDAGTTTVLGDPALDDSRADIDGDIVVWDVRTAAGDLDLAVHDLSTGLTTVVPRAGDQRGPHVSGDVVSVDDSASGNPDVSLYHVPTGALQTVAADPGAELLNEIGGNRLVYSSNQSGNFDIWMYEFTVQLPEVAVAPLDVDFGDVTVGAAGSTIVTVSNVGALPLTVSGVTLTQSGSAFSYTPPALPAIVTAGGTIDIPVAFGPTATGTRTASLAITSDDVDEATVQVALTGRGVVSQPSPGQQIAGILAFFDSSVTAGTLQGSGQGNSATGRRGALRNMLEAAGDLIRRGLIADACQQLADARDRTDGLPQPPDFVQGSAAPELKARIQVLRERLGCP